MSTLANRYKIIKNLGAGGFSQVYLAKDLQRDDRRRCVVKQLQPKSDDPFTVRTARRLFKTEVNVLQKLGNHDRIPQLYVSFEENRQFYLVEQYITGQGLSRELTWWHWTEAKTVAFLQDILETLAFVHRKQVIHRDIKPENLIRRDRDQRIVLIDFGSVKKRQPADYTAIVGTQGYMPPEQLLGKPRLNSDIYAVGMIALRGLTGIDPAKTAFPTDPDTGEFLWQHKTNVSPELAQVLNTMVRQDHRHRYPSAQEALQAVSQLGEASAPSRRRLLQAAGLSVMGLLGTGMAYPALSQELPNRKPSASFPATDLLSGDTSTAEKKASAEKQPDPVTQSIPAQEQEASQASPALATAPQRLDKQELLRRYGSYNECRKIAKANGIKFSTTPTWDKLVYAFSYSEALQQISQVYLRTYPNPALAGITVELTL
ncbi:serine/threonine-protein kinase [Acaryochloris sp. IP29b_bin.137]|uniref:serine/threonine-protein kinase n=1 Tax=Acaryochloris sp. IP29b_bin.137 TaxID=2969217 RepID=UPI00260C11F1|nr:serine/threonine-protein kinase [Acaryochloris sp. IP29b_bin.137]